MSDRNSVQIIQGDALAGLRTLESEFIQCCVTSPPYFGLRECDLVLDPFSGSGTTGIGSLKHNRRYVGIELSPEYIEIAKRRLKEVQPRLSFGE